MRVEKDNCYLDSIVIKIRNSKGYSEENLKNIFPTENDCKFKIRTMNEYFEKNGKINLGLRVSQKIIKLIGPTDKLNLKSSSADYF